MKTSLQQSIDRHLLALAELRNKSERVQEIVTRIEQCLRNGGKIMTCGNGGSAAEALHLAEEMMGRFRRSRPPLAAVCLSADPTALTCIANDFGYDEVFARQVQGIGRKGDVLVVLTTSGKSKNVLMALERARGLGIYTIGLLGIPGTPAEAMCELAFTTPTPETAHIQELHLIVTHLILEHLDEQFD